VNKHLLILFACLLVVMIGFGITLPVLPFYAERLALAQGATRKAVAIHVSLLTSLYALMQLLFSPLWGVWSDRVGRRRLVLIGIAGTVIAQALFGVATTLWLLYGARAVGGILSSATLVAAAAYVADETSVDERGRGMAWMGTAVSLGAVTGLAIGGISTRRDLHFIGRYGHLKVDSFSIPFFVAAALALLTLGVALRWLPESLPPGAGTAPGDAVSTGWRELGGKLRLLLGLSTAGQFGLAIFESTFALYAQERMRYGPVQVGAVFTVCGLVMAVFQGVGVGYLSGRVREISQISVGFGLMGAGIVLLLTAHRLPLVLAVVGLLALGMALITPNLSALISTRGGLSAGAALGMQNAANSIGQVGGPLFGGMLFAWRAGAPFVLAGIFLVGVGLIVGWRERQRPGLK
jgi:DHA1 family multidrug resistance protein-like MFS transporter